jgi:hypothetical protein
VTRTERACNADDVEGRCLAEAVLGQSVPSPWEREPADGLDWRGDGFPARLRSADLEIFA